MKLRTAMVVSGLLAVCFAADASVRLAESRLPETVDWYDAATQLKVEQIEDLDSVDVVLAGTSMAWQGLVPDTFSTTASGSPTAWNAGLAGGVPPVMSPWLLDHVEPALSPSTVVWGLSSLDVAPAYGEQNVEAWDRAPRTDQRLLARLDRSLGEVSAVVRHRRSLRDPAGWGDVLTDDEELLAEAAEILGRSGERLDFAVDVSDDRAAVQRARLDRFGVSRSDIEIVETTARELLSRGVDVVLVEMPVPTRFIELHPRGMDDHAQVGLRLAEVAERTGVAFVDLSDGYADDAFVDFTHLSEGAADDLTERLATILDGAPDPGIAVEFRGSGGGDASFAERDEECVVEEVVDEYGFVVEVCR